MFSVGVLTVSDKGARGERVDLSGPEIERFVSDLGGSVLISSVVPDERPLIESTLIEWSDQRGCDLILTTGGTGLALRDVTPEATLAVVDRLVPGMQEAMRAAGLKNTPHAMLSRGVAGTRGRTLIVNLPGSPRAVRENLESVRAALPHAIEILRGDYTEHPAGH